MKHLKACVMVGSALLIASFILLALPTPHGTYFVLAAPNNDNYGESCIYHITLHCVSDDEHEFVEFWDTGETQYIAEGSILLKIHVSVYIDNTYAETADNASAYTRVHVLLKDPSEETVYDNILPNSGTAQKYDNCWLITYWSPELEETLVPGKYTITTTYEIYIEP